MRTSLSPRSSACKKHQRAEQVGLGANLDAQRANAFGRRRRGTRARVLQPDARTARDVAEVRRELRARHDVVLAFEQARTHGAHRRIGDVLQLRISRAVAIAARSRASVARSVAS